MTVKAGTIYGIYNDEQQAWGAFCKQRHKWHPPGTPCESKECEWVPTPWHPRAIRANLLDLQDFFVRGNLFKAGYRVRQIDDQA
jgi:hypothetical protein